MQLEIDDKKQLLFVSVSEPFSRTTRQFRYGRRRRGHVGGSRSSRHLEVGVMRGKQGCGPFGDTGVRTRGAGEGKSFTEGEIGEGELSGQGELLSSSFSGDSTSLSPIWMSVLILCARGGRFEGERALGEIGRGRFFTLWGFTGEADTAWRRCTQA